MEKTLSEKLAHHQLALQLNQLPDAVIQAAKLHILDSLDCLLAGSRLEPESLPTILLWRAVATVPVPLQPCLELIREFHF
jgi:hypothetical protein